MNQRFHVRSLQAFLFTLAALALAAPVWAQAPTPLLRQVLDGTGRSVKIPTKPSRLVVMHEALLGVPLLELGVNVVGAYGRDDEGRSLFGVDAIGDVLGPRPGAAPVRGIGAVGGLDLERLRALKPDLILGTELDLRHVPALSIIAPVYLQRSTSTSTHGFAAQQALASLLGREAAFAALVQDYERQLAAVKPRLPRRPGALPGQYLAIFLHDRINVVGTISGMVQAIEDLGYQRLRLGVPDAPASDPSARQSTLMEPISTEAFGRLDPDLMFIMRTFVSQPQGEVGAGSDLDKLTPGWRRFLKPAREGRVIYLDSVKVTTPSVASARHTLQAIQRWLDQRPAQ